MKTSEPVIVGSMALDTVKSPFGTVKDAFGGSAAYASLAASYFSKPSVVSIVGDDFPAAHLKMLNNYSIDTEGVNHTGKTFRWSGSYEYDMNEATTHKTELNSLADFKPMLPEHYRSSRFIFLANLDPEQQNAVINQLEPGATVLLDTMNYWITSKREALRTVIGRVHILLLNEAEARQLCNTASLVKAAHLILGMGPQYVIIKKGEDGALLFSSGSHFSAPGYPLEDVRDPTGAGDSFAGGLIGYLAQTKDISEDNLRRAIIYGSVIASFCAEHFSVEYREQTSRKDIEERYNVFKQICRF